MRDTHILWRYHISREVDNMRDRGDTQLRLEQNHTKLADSPLLFVYFLVFSRRYVTPTTHPDFYITHVHSN